MKSILIYSGGLDSTVLLYQLLDQGHSVSALSIDYGQRHKKELLQAKQICEELDVEHRVADLSSISSFFGASSLTDTSVDVPKGHYESVNMKQTVVPNRNMIMLSVAAAWAMSKKCDTIAYAAHGGDHAIYPDCRSEFADAMNAAIGLADWHKVSLYRPFVEIDKTGIVRLGADLKVPFEKTWSCYCGEDLHCGACGTCVERREAFHLAGVEDPTVYQGSAPKLETLILNNWKIS